MINDKIFFDEKDPAGINYDTPFVVFGSFNGRLWSKTPEGTVKFYVQGEDIINDLTTGGATKVLSAEQGVEVKSLIDNGITEIDTFILTVAFSGNALPITSNLSRMSGRGVTKKGTGVTNTSGVFSFPSVGQWEVTFQLTQVNNGGNEDVACGGIIEATLNNSTYERVIDQSGSISSSASTPFISTSLSIVLNVTDIANVKVRFSVFVVDALTTTVVNVNYLRTGMIFKKLGGIA